MIERPARDYCGEAIANAGIKPYGNALSRCSNQHSESASQQVADGIAQGNTWPTIDNAAYYGLAGDIVRTIAPHTEADPVAILIQVLAYFGNIIGRAAHYRVEADHHHANLFVVLVGQSAKGRKGTSGSRARSVMKAADERWLNE